MHFLFPAHFQTCFPRSFCICCYAVQLSLRAVSPATACSEVKAAELKKDFCFPVECPASYKDGCRKALHNCSRTYSNLSTFLHLLYLIGIRVKRQHIDATKLVKNKETRAKFCISEGRQLHFRICTRQCTKENRCLGQKQRQETHRCLVA